MNNNIQQLNKALKIFNIDYEIKNIEDIQNIPISDRTNLYDWNFEKCPTKPKYIQATSGTTSKKSLIFFDEDAKNAVIDRYNQIFKIYGLNDDDIILNFFNYGFAGHGMDVEYACKNINCTMIPIGDAKEFLNKLGLKIVNKEIKPNKAIMFTGSAYNRLSLIRTNEIESIIVGGQYLHPFYREKIKNEFNVKVYNGFGMSEFGAIGIEEFPGENRFKLVDNLIYEVLKEDNKTDFNGVGELIITDPYNLCTKMIRYLTGDIVKLDNGYMKFIKRIGDLIKINGELFSKQMLIENIGNILKSNYFLIVIKDEPKLCKDNVYLFTKEILNDKIQSKIINFFMNFKIKIKTKTNEKIMYKSTNTEKFIYIKDLRDPKT